MPLSNEVAKMEQILRIMKLKRWRDKEH